MEWKKKGLIFVTKGNKEWSITHAQVPKPLFVEPGKLRIYYGTRDSLNRTYASFIDVNPENPKEIFYLHDSPIMNLGETGAFDENGVMPSCFIYNNKEILMYYTGWSNSVIYPYHVNIGIARSRDNGVTFERVSTEPVFKKDFESISCSQPFLLTGNSNWKMWYSSFTKWIKYKGKEEPIYKLKYSESIDGINWNKGISINLDNDENDYAYTNPSVWKENNMLRMVYSYRKGIGYRVKSSSSYRIGIAISNDGINWEKDIHFSGLGISKKGWDSDMIEYPAIYSYKGITYLLYNGNGFGRTGFGYAKLEREI